MAIEDIPGSLNIRCIIGDKILLNRKGRAVFWIKSESIMNGKRDGIIIVTQIDSADFVELIILWGYVIQNRTSIDIKIVNMYFFINFLLLSDSLLLFELE